MKAIALAARLVALVALAVSTTAQVPSPPPSPEPTGAPSAAPADSTGPTLAPADSTSPTLAPADSTSPTLAPAPSPAPSESATPEPRAPGIATGPLQYFAGTHWSCVTFSGSQGTHDYASTGPGSFTVHVAFTTDARQTVVLDEAYSFDATRPEWKVVLGRGFAAISQEWSPTDWVFTGRQRVGRTRVPFRVEYHMFGRQAFRRDFQTKRKGKWITYAGETCELAS